MVHSVCSYVSVPDGLIEVLTKHLPYSLPILRRLQFTKFNHGASPSSRIIVASETDHLLNGEVPGTTKIAVAFLDFPSGPETEMWLYSSLEDGQVQGEDLEYCEEQIEALFGKVREVSLEYDQEKAYPGAVLLGTLNSAVREVMERRGLPVLPRPTGNYDKWLFRLDELPDEGVSLPEGMRWDRASLDDCKVAVSRTNIPRQA